MDGERHGDVSPASLLCGDSGMILSSDTDSSTAEEKEMESLAFIPYIFSNDCDYPTGQKL